MEPSGHHDIWANFGRMRGILPLNDKQCTFIGMCYINFELSASYGIMSVNIHDMNSSQQSSWSCRGSQCRIVLAYHWNVYALSVVCIWYPPTRSALSVTRVCVTMSYYLVPMSMGNKVDQVVWLQKFYPLCTVLWKFSFVTCIVL